MKKILAILAIPFMFACSRDDAHLVSDNISKAADNFEVMRRIVFINTNTGEYLLTIEGLCSIGSARETSAVTVTCKVGPSSYKKHALGLSMNTAYVSEHIDASNVSASHYRVTYKPLSIIPDIEIRK